jgi:colicin import membrane protein
MMGVEISTDLISIPDADALATFTTPGALDPILAKVRERLDSFVGDTSTAAGRQQIKSMAFAVAKSKSYLETVGKRLADDAKDLPKKIDAGRRHAKTTLEQWHAEVRAPLDQWEAAEAARIAKHTEAIEAWGALASIRAEWKAADYRTALARLKEMELGEWCEEFTDAYRKARDEGIGFLTEIIATKEKAERDEAELAELRAEKERREAAESAEREAREAAEREAARLRAEEERIALVATKAAERAAREATEAAERAARMEREAAEVREAELRHQIAETERRARQEALDAARKAEAEEADRKRREANRAHKAKVNRAAVAALSDSAGLTEEQAMAVVQAVATGRIPGVSISY